MTAIHLAAQEFVAIFEALAQFIGRAAALIDARVQAARRRYIVCRKTGVLGT